ncbi:MAG: N-acetylmuramoyl-L-alanine amidase [Burkholderiales bacterium]|nr:N-acetylmuramoyl-L-alanine amidase [Burkholderiales bacterium]
MTSAPSRARPRAPAFPPSRREFLRATTGVLLLGASSPLFAQAAAIVAVRVWPSREYTRVTLELDAPLRYTHQLVRNPDRLVLDIEDLELSGRLKDIVAKITPNDPYLAAVRAGQFKQRVVRLVFDLKTEISPQVFALKPVGEYGHRLVLDLYPATPADPLLALVDKQALPADMVPRENEADAREPARSADAPRPDGTARADAAREPAPARPQMTRMITIALDPGHGGEDPGAVGRRGTYEKHVTLAVARRLKAKIDAEPNMRTMLTRDSDYFVPLGVRVQKARKVQADLFVSIHADAWIKPTARGSSVFALSERGATSSAAGWLAKKENDADLIGGVNLGTHDRDLARVLLDLSTTAQINDSLKVGRAVLAELGNINDLHKARVEQAGFAVLKAPDIPSILVETAFISNPDEEKRLNDENYQDKIATSILRGIKAYFAKNPPLAKSKLASL